jgi:hypothetical protein
MKKYMLLHFGFEKPTPEIMGAWGKWFESIADRTVESGGFSGAREISESGTRELPMGMESITGYNIIAAESLERIGETKAVLGAPQLDITSGTAQLGTQLEPDGLRELFTRGRSMSVES